MAVSSAGGQGVSPGIAERTQDCLNKIKDGKGQASVIILLGRTGAGKSSVLEDITGVRGHVEDKNGEEIVTEKIQVEEANYGGKQFFIMDTPGFDTSKEEETFNEIVRGIQEVRDRTQNWGVLYVTAIGSASVRKKEIEEKLLGFIRCFCGTDHFQSLTFVTTHWSSNDEDRSKMNKLLENQEKLWRSYLDNGARVYHHGRKYSNGVDTGNSLSWRRNRQETAQYVRDMVSCHYGHTARIPLIVRELRGGCPTRLTTAGTFLISSRPSSKHRGSSYFESPDANHDEIPESPGFSNNSADEKSHQGEHPTEHPRQSNQPQTDESNSSQSLWERFRAGEFTEITSDGPLLSVRDGRARINGRTVVDGLWDQAASWIWGANPTRLDPSLVNYLQNRGMRIDMESRRQLAAALGLDPSSIGTSEGNTSLLNRLRAHFS